MSNQIDVAQLLNLLESQELTTAIEIKDLILENLIKVKDAWLVNALVDFYVQTQSKKSLEVLDKVTEPNDKYLLDRITEHLKGETYKLQSLMLLGHLVRNQPPWMHKIVQHSILSNVLKIIKSEVDVPILMSAVLLITNLLPLVPVSISQYLQDIFDGFSRLAAFNLKKPGSVPDVYLLHLQVGIYCLFHRLYGMYPCHFLTYLRLVYSKKENAQVFEETVMPMLERVRMHPLLVTATKDREVSRERWKQLDVHDIIVDCAKLSLDMIEGSREDTRYPVVGLQRSPQHQSLTSTDINRAFTELMGSDVPDVIGVDKESGIRPIIESIDNGSFFSPCEVCAMTTPPPTPKSTTTSADLSGSGAAVTPSRLSGIYTPVPESPQTEDSMSLSQKRLSGLSLSLAGLTPLNTSGGSVPPSPLHKLFTDPPTPVYHAVRKIDFQIRAGETSVSATTDTSATLSPITDQKEESSSGQSLSDPSSLDQSLLFTKTSHNETSLQQTTSANNQQNSEMMEKNDSKPTAMFDESDVEPPVKPNTSDQHKSIQHSLEEFKHISVSPGKFEASKQKLSRKPSVKRVTSESDGQSGSSDLQPAESDSQTDSTLMSPHAKEAPVKIPSKKLIDYSEQQSHSLPSVSDLPHFIESLEVAHDDGDDEVSALTGSQIEDASLSSSTCTDPSDLTAESVQQFMKNVNRIRFNSMNVNTRERVERLEKAPRLYRPSSCPDFEKATEEDVIAEDLDSMTYSRKSSGADPGIKVKSDSVQFDMITTHTVTSSVTMVTNSKATIASQTSFVNLGDIDTERSSQIQEMMSEEDLHTYIPYAHMFQTALPFAPFLPCYNCRKASDTSSGESSDKTQDNLKTPDYGRDEAFFSTLSPPELLDRHIQLGTDIHTKQLAHYEATGSKPMLGVEGMAVYDDVEILHGQLLLLHNQLMYERHKREMYAKRNRRLLGRIVKTAALEEQTVAMRDQLVLQENEIQNLTDTTKAQQNDIKRLKSAVDKLEYEKETGQRNWMQDRETLKRTNIHLQNQLQKQKLDNDKLLKELQGTRSQLFNTKHELDSVKVRADFSAQLQGQLARVNKELLLMGELQQKYQQRLVSVSSSQNTSAETKFLLESCKEEIRATKQGLEEKTIVLDFTKGKLAEAEETLKIKESAISELQKTIENHKDLHIGQIQALDAKYKNERMIQQALQGDILALTAKLHSLETPAQPQLPCDEEAVDSSQVDENICSYEN